MEQRLLGVHVTEGCGPGIRQTCLSCGPWVEGTQVFVIANFLPFLLYGLFHNNKFVKERGAWGHSEGGGSEKDGGREA